MKTWHFEMLAVGLVLSCVALVRGGWHEWLATAAVLLTFGHANVAERMRERDAARSTPEVHCVAWLWRYFVAKEVLWIAFFLATASYAALAGCFVFLAFPLWRRWWRARNPLDREVKHGNSKQEEPTP